MSKKRLNGSERDSLSPWYLTTDQVVKALGTDVNKGLSPAQVQALHEQHGFNELVKQPGKPLWKLVLEQFDDMLVKVRADHVGARHHTRLPRSCCSPLLFPLCSHTLRRQRARQTVGCVHT